MFERFTEHAKRVLELEGIEAQRMHHDYLGTEHLLLALIHEPEGHGHRALAELGISLKQARASLSSLVQEGPHKELPKGFHQTPQAKQVMAMALEEARVLKRGKIGTEHLLLALLREPDGVAVHVLEKLGLTADQIRSEIEDMLEEERRNKVAAE